MKRRLMDWAPIPLRLMLGAVLIDHGLRKLFDPIVREKFVATLQSVDFPSPVAFSWISGAVESVCGLALVLGVATILSCIFLIADLGVIAAKVYRWSGFDDVHVVSIRDGQPVYGLPGYELSVAYIAMLVSLIFSGPGMLTMARRKAKQPDPPTGSG